jgi:predicted ATPase
LIGRDHDVRAALRLLMQHEMQHEMQQEVALVTLTGPPGTGKTRLGQAVAAELIDQFPDGVHFVSLASTSDPALVPAAIAQALDVRDVGGRPILDSLVDFVAARRLLLVLDNFEHLLPAATVVSELLAASPGLKVLVTSREPLAVRDEHEVPVAPLAVPSSASTLAVSDLCRIPSVALFVERATAIKPDFAVTESNASAIAEICRRLDGLPLAIELAAARVRLLDPSSMLARLDRRLALLTSGPRDLPERQRTLRAAIAWSHELLTDEQKQLFRRLAVFSGGFSLAAAEAIFSHSGGPSSVVLELLASLVSRNLVRTEHAAATGERFGMLETLREYAIEQLEISGELEDVKDRHLTHVVAFAEAAARELQGPDQATWFDRLEGENDNLRVALEWTYALGTSPLRLALGVRLARAQGFYWIVRGRGRENLPRVLRLVALTAEGSPERAWAQTVVAQILGPMLGNNAQALPIAEEALATMRALGDPLGTAVALVRCGQATGGSGDFARAAGYFAQAIDLYRGLDAGYGPELPTAIMAADAIRGLGDHRRAEALYAEAIAEARERGDGHGVAHALREVARLRRMQGNPSEAFILLRESAEVIVPLNDIRCAYSCLEDFAATLADYDEPVGVARMFGAAESIRELIGRPLHKSQIEVHDRAVRKVEGLLAADVFRAAWDEGRKLSVEQAIRYALERPPPP